MLCAWFQTELLGFVSRSARAMGCFFGCFGTRDHRHHQTHFVTQSIPSQHTEAVASENALSSLLRSEGKDGLPCKEGNPKLETTQPDIDAKALRDQAKFLKACGTCPETPIEIRKTSSELNSSPSGTNSEPLKFHSWFPSTSLEKIKLEKQPDETPSPVKPCEEWEMGSGSQLFTPNSSITHETSTGRMFTQSSEGNGIGNTSLAFKSHGNQAEKSTAADSTRTFEFTVQRRNKSVRFESNLLGTTHSSGSSSSEIASQNSMKSDFAGNYSVRKPSPNPTPLRLTDEMQTPGTVFPAYVDKLENGRNPRVRSQYVYPVLNPIENVDHRKEVKVDDPVNQLSGNLGASLEQVGNVTPNIKLEKRETVIDECVEVEARLMSRLKQLPIDQDNNTEPIHCISSRSSHSGKTPGDRPILGMVAAHWIEDESTRISPKWWNGNGIPNSTNKYKEDQKVSWHATPFEERLEKALSEETSICQRKNVCERPLDLDESEESDTALSQLQSSTHCKPVVSF